MKNPRQRRGHPMVVTGIASAVLMLAAGSAQAVSIETDVEDLSIRWDNTVKFSSAYRLKDASNGLTTGPFAANSDDGDLNFKKGFVSNRLDLLSEFDASYQKKLGLRVSAAAWYDNAYQGSNDNSSPFTVNNASVASNRFNSHTKRLHGRDGEVLDAFIYGNGRLGESAVVGRLGRHTVLYGESLFFGDNGIAGGQAPIDVLKLLSVPNSQFKEVIRPVNQLSGQIQVLDNLAVGAYYQLKWEASRLPSTGSYFSNADFIEGGERFLLGPAGTLARGTDMKPGNDGQGGLQVRWRPNAMDVELGFYAIRFHEKSPHLNLNPGPGSRYFNPAINQVGDYQLGYGEGIKAYGMSFSTEAQGINFAGEVSVRRNTPLVSETSTGPSPVYAVGNSAHAQLSMIAFLSPNSLFDSASLLGEIAANTRTSVTKNESALAVESSRSAWAMRFVFEPVWYRVSDGWDLSAPIGLGYSTRGNSSVVSQFNGGVKKGGDLSFGIKAVYQQTWNFGLTYTKFLGAEGLTAAPNLTFKQSLKDRDYIAFSVQHSF